MLFKVDVYALACILNECWMRRPPWGREHDHFCQIIMQVPCRTHVSFDAVCSQLRRR